MRIAFQPTFSDLIENFLATHYSGGVQTVRRLAGGPVILLLGALTVVAANAWLVAGLLRGLLIVVGLAFAFLGLFLTLVPVVNIFLIWLRRDQLLGDQSSPTILEIHGDALRISQNREEFDLPLARIKSIQHRGEGTWLLTDSDHLISIPRHGLLEGDHDVFVLALEEAMGRDEHQK